jgi:hypothetical protein
LLLSDTHNDLRIKGAGTMIARKTDPAERIKASARSGDSTPRAFRSTFALKLLAASKHCFLIPRPRSPAWKKAALSQLRGSRRRPSGIACDVRADYPYGIYRYSSVPSPTLDSGDAYVRAKLPALEIRSSI